jgi:hypothetical protein
MIYLSAGVYLSGPGSDLRALFERMNSSDLALVQAKKSDRDVWYINFPNFQFSALSLATELVSYIGRYQRELAVSRVSPSVMCVLALRGAREMAGFYINLELLQLLAQFSVSLDFDPSPVANPPARWQP